MDPLRPIGKRDEITRLRAKLNQTTDQDIRSALSLKIESLELEAASEVALVDSPATPLAETSEVATPVARLVPTFAPEEEARLRGELARLQVRVDKAEDEDVREALYREVLRVHFILLGHPLAEEKDRTDAPKDTATRQQIDRAETLIREARVERMRSNNAKADALMKEATEAAPDSVQVFSALGDEMVERKQWGKARDMYRQALDRRPNDPALERKLGDLVLRMGPSRSIEDQLRGGLSDSPFLTAGDAVATARTATILSIFCPGLGQLVMGKTVQGIVTFLFWALMVGWVVVRKDDLKDLVSAASSSKARGGGGYLVLLPLGAALVVHVSAVMACATRAKMSGKRSVSRPTPPMNLPFE